MSARGPPSACPACGGDVVDGDDGLVCDDCGRAIGVIDTKGDRGDDVDT